MFEHPEATSIYANAAQLSENLRSVSIKDYKDWRVFNVLHRVCLDSWKKKIWILNCYFSMHLKWLLLILATNQMSKYKNC